MKHLTSLFATPNFKAVLGLGVTLSMTSLCVTAEPIDQRQILKLNEAQRAHILGEMRSLQSGTQAILAALAADNMLEVAQQARLLGMGMGHKAENHLHDILPDAFMQMGMSVHHDFDRIARDAQTLKDSKLTLQQLSTTMKTCTACHETYQIRTRIPKHQR